jgi:hypothetical protein
VPSLKQAALAASKASQEAAREQRAAEREKALDELLANWDSRATLEYKGDALPKPKRDAFTYVPYPGFTYGNGRGRNQNVHGWTWETDDLTFIYDASYHGEGLCIVITCPDCGERHADHVYGLEGLGRLLARGRADGHECRAVVARELAYAIRRASEKTGLPALAIVQEALEV